ncbi:MAG: HEAT repeat domain-containing protein [Deltaproteobacteria bacterium]|nr:HEAT repeat domain-containing protein [Deltaproteobacteria bacterium]
MMRKILSLFFLALGLAAFAAPSAAAGDDTCKVPGYVLTQLQQTCLEVSVTSGSPDSISDVALLTKSSNTRVRAVAAYSLGESHDPQAIEYLLPLLRDPDHHVQRIAATAIGKIGDQSTTSCLIVLLNTSQETHVKAAAIMALGRTGGTGSLTAIEKHADSQSGWIRYSVVQARVRLASSQEDVAPR